MTGSAINILLIEDNPGDIRLVEEALRDGEVVHHLRAIMRGDQALDYLFQRPPYQDTRLPDLILLDLNIPKVSGLDILKALKDDALRHHIPIVILSSSDADPDITASYELHANCYIQKPLALDDFIKTIHEIEHFWLSVVKLP